MLNRKIVIERFTQTADGVGGFTESWAADPPGGVWAQIKSGWGFERGENQRVSPINSFTAVIRFRDDGNGHPYYSSADRVVIGGRQYNIDSVMDIDMQRKWISMQIVEGEAV